MTDPVTVQPTRDQLRALADAATPGPWRIGEAFDEPACWVAHLSDNGWDDSTTVTSQDTTGRADQEVLDAEFIAAARTALPQLLDQLAAAEQRIRDLAQEVADERGAALDQMEQVRIRDARIQAVRDMCDTEEDPDQWPPRPVMHGGEPFPATLYVEDIRRALEG